jgi:hypothetical protein
MRVILAAVITTSLITAPAAAQYVVAPGCSTPSKKHVKSKRTKATASYAQQYRGSPYSTNPAYDVYVNGEYVGSDPDPRVRATLAAEWRSQWGLH